MDLNVPDTRQQLLSELLDAGEQLNALAIARKFGISVDTVRRDLIALEDAGLAKRVRGGAIPISKPGPSMLEKAERGIKPPATLIDAVLSALEGKQTLLLDSGSTLLALARKLTPIEGLVVITPSPWVAIACLERDIETILIGGRLSPRSGTSVGGDCLAMLSSVAADVAVLGACGIDPVFGLSSDDFDEVPVKQRMADCAARTWVVSDCSKLGLRARHRALLPSQIDRIITTAEGSTDASTPDPYKAQGIEIDYV
ncbi:MAG: DeoR/GlpR family DNA-binding transcription regulator [Stappiaceae bacterium]